MSLALTRDTVTDATRVFHAQWARRGGFGMEQEDALQVFLETLCRLQEGKGAYDPERGSHWRYLHMVCASSLKNQLRNSHRRGRDLMDLGGEEDVALDLGETGVRDAPSRVDVLKALRAIEGLPKRQAEAITLVHLRGLSLGEASSIMGVSGARVGQLNQRGLETLRKQLS